MSVQVIKKSILGRQRSNTAAPRRSTSIGGRSIMEAAPLGDFWGIGEVWVIYGILSVQESVMRTVRGWLILEIFPLGSNGSIQSFGRYVVIFNAYLY